MSLQHLTRLTNKSRVMAQLALNLMAFDDNSYVATALNVLPSTLKLALLYLTVKGGCLEESCQVSTLLEDTKTLKIGCRSIKHFA